jgi:hypothetical protein
MYELKDERVGRYAQEVDQIGQVLQGTYAHLDLFIISHTSGYELRAPLSTHALWQQAQELYANAFQLSQRGTWRVLNETRTALLVAFVFEKFQVSTVGLGGQPWQTEKSHYVLAEISLPLNR